MPTARHPLILAICPTTDSRTAAALPFGNSDRLEVGDFVFAIGNPPPIGQTVSAGIVSGLHRVNVGIGPYEDFIQTDAAIYPGNSCGALVDLRGDLVGINTAFIAVGKDNPGMSFAIPINMARSLVEQMLEPREKYHRGFAMPLSIVLTIGLCRY
jgi:serine protease Do